MKAMSISEKEFVPCGEGENICNCKSESECGYLPEQENTAPKQAVLLKDVWSRVNAKTQYGKAGDKVIIISEHETCSIVEAASGNKKGNRYPVKNELLRVIE